MRKESASFPRFSAQSHLAPSLLIFVGLKTWSGKLFMRTKFLDLFLATALLVVVVSAFSYTWTPMSPTSLSGVISMSADGRIVCVCPSTSGQLRISRDWGQTWFRATNAPVGGSPFGNPVALSANGSQIIACLSSNTFNPHWIFLSTDFGTNWTKLNLPGLQNVFSGYCIACSANGSNLIAAENLGPIHFSTNSGADWSTATAPSTNWVSVASSADGRRMVAAVRDERVYFSTNFGSTWTSSNLSTQKWASVCISSDGNSVGAIGTNSYISRDAGSHWLTNKFSNASIACSANGTTWMIAGAQVYTSSDGGVTWMTNFSNAAWGGAMSADGCEIVVNQNLGLED